MDRTFEGRWWWIIDNKGQQRGPMSRIEVLDLIETGRLTSADLAWRQGLNGWSPVGSHPEFVLPPPQPNLAPQASEANEKAGFFGSAFKEVTNLNDALSRLKDAGTVTFIFAVMQFLGALLFLYQQTNSEDMLSGAVGFAIVITLLVSAGFAMRMGRGGLMLPALVLIFFLFELAYKVLVTPHPSLVFWMFFYAYIAGALVSGFRAALFLRRRRAARRPARAY